MPQPVTTPTTESTPRRTVRSAKQAGERFERLTADYLATATGQPVERRRLGGSADRGDISGLTLAGERVVVECKDHSKPALNMWVNEVESERQNDGASFGVVAHKRAKHAAGGDQYITMSMSTFARIISKSDDLQAEVERLQAVIDHYEERRPAPEPQGLPTVEVTVRVRGAHVVGFDCEDVTPHTVEGEVAA